MENKTDYSNIGASIKSKIGRELHNKKNHPIWIIKNYIYSYFDTLEDYNFDKFDNLSPFVSIVDNFDKLLIPKNHPARSKSDTYYVNEKTVLRTHTSAHQNELLQNGYENFLIVGDVYRKDEIDKHHYPVFHQMEGVMKVPKNENAKDLLLKVLSGLVKYLFPGKKYRINNDYFPFTEPSFEIEVYYEDKWLEILGCGVMHKDIIKNNNLEGEYIAFGLGLERYCLLAFEIPDIRYLWSEHKRFLEQFVDGKIVKFKPYSELPTQYKDISFWITKENIRTIKKFEAGQEIELEVWTEENEFFDIIREICCDYVCEVKLVDKFYHPKKKIHSRMYRIIYMPSDVSLKNPAEFTNITNKSQEKIRSILEDKLKIILR